MARAVCPGRRFHRRHHPGCRGVGLAGAAEQRADARGRLRLVCKSHGDDGEGGAYAPRPVCPPGAGEADVDDPALTTEKALFSCPACGGALTADREAYRCPGCVRIYPIVFGIPDFRLAPDPYISFVEEYEKARVLAEEAERRSFEELVRFYWQMTPGVPPEAVARYTRYALDGERRARVYLNAVDVH